MRQRTGRAVGVAAYRACVRAGKKEAAARIAGEMRALGLPDPDGQLCEDMTVS